MSTLVFAICLLLLVNGALPQAEMLVFDGRFPLPWAAFKVILLAVLLLVLLVKGSVVLPKELKLPWLLFATYLVIDAFVLRLRGDYSWLDVFSGYNGYYFFLLVLPLIFSLRGRVAEPRLLGTVVPLFVGLALLGLAQAALNRPLMPTASVDGGYTVPWNWYGRLRAFSLFGSAWEFGQFVAWIAPLPLLGLLRSRPHPAHLGLLVLVLAAAGVTLTRNVYVQVFFVSGAAVAFALFGRLRRALIALPLLYLVAGLAIAMVAAFLPQNAQAGVLSGESAGMRFASWADFGRLWLGRDVGTALFGTGYVQSDRFSVADQTEAAYRLELSSKAIDNVFVAVGVHIGLVGLLLFLGLMWATWSFIFRRALEDRSVTATQLACFWSTWMLSGMFNLNLSTYGLTLFLTVLAMPAAKEPARSADGRAQPLGSERQEARLA